MFTNPRVTDTIGVRGYSSAKGLAHPQRVQSAQPHLAIRDSVDLAKEQLSDRSAKRPKVNRVALILLRVTEQDILIVDLHIVASTKEERAILGHAVRGHDDPQQ